MTKNDELGKVAWERYSKTVGGKSFNGKPLPSWDDLGETQKLGWNEAIVGVFEDIGSKVQVMDKKYKGTKGVVNWQELWTEILAFIASHIPTANTVPTPPKPTPNTG